METVQSGGRWSWLAVPRAVWLGAAAFGIAAMSAGAAMWLQPKPAATPVVAESKVPLTAPVAEKKPQGAPLAQAKTPPAAPEAPVCTTCGVVESVQAVKRKGEGTGLGAVAGGVVGGAVGNQFGKGNGRAAMTVLGAVGGGFAGHEIEKQARAETVYTVRVRMNDGTVRTVTRQQPVAVGARVTVNGQTLRLAQSASEAAGS